VTLGAARRTRYVAPIAAAIVTLVAALALGACGGGDRAASDASGTWERLPDPPLSPRENALGLWTGEETLVLGGSDADPCPPTADCEAPSEPPLRDGAAVDPTRGSWRPIADAPVGFSGAEGALIGETAYIWTNGEVGRPGAPHAFLSYRIRDDRWEELPAPPREPYRSIVAAGTRVVAFTTTDEYGGGPDLVFDPATATWSELPDDPLPRSFDRTMAWTGSELVLFGKEIVPQPGAHGPSLALAAALDLDSGEWRRLSDSESRDQYVTNVRWFAVDGRLINPAPGASDGGDNGWGRTYADGGVLDPQSGQWVELPEAPAGFDEASFGQYGSGILAGPESHYFAPYGWVLDAAAWEWMEIPRFDDRDTVVSGRTVTNAAEEMLVFGGTRYRSDSLHGELLNEAWSWSPRGE
jgi:hypothetical protein